MSDFSGTISIYIERGKGLKNVQTIGKQDPYVIALLDSLENKESERRTEVHDNGGVDPVWAKRYQKAWVVRGRETGIWLRVFDQENVSKDRLIGQVNVLMRDLLAAKSTPFTIVGTDGAAAGQIIITTHAVKAANAEELKKLEAGLQNAANELKSAQESLVRRHAEEKAAAQLLAEKQRVAAEEKKKTDDLEAEYARRIAAQREALKKAEDEKAAAERDAEARRKRAEDDKAAFERAFHKHVHPLVEQECTYPNATYVCRVCKEQKTGKVHHCPADHYDECPACYPTHSGRA